MTATSGPARGQQDPAAPAAAARGGGVSVLVAAGWAGDVGFGVGGSRLIKPPRAESRSGMARSRFTFF